MNKILVRIREHKRITIILIFTVILYIFFLHYFEKVEMFQNNVNLNIAFALIPNLVATILIYFGLQEGISAFTQISHTPRSNQQLIQELEISTTSKESIKILDIRIYALLTEKNKKTGKSDWFEETVCKVILKTEIDILLLNPFASSFKQRAEDMTRMGGAVSDDQFQESYKKYLLQHLEGLYKLYKIKMFTNDNYKNNLQVKLFNSLPSITIHFFEHQGFISIFPPNKKTDDSIAIKVNQNSDFANNIKKHFLDIWSDEGKTFSLEEFVLLKLPILDSDKEFYQLKDDINLYYTSDEKLNPVYFAQLPDEKVRTYFKDKRDKKMELRFSIVGRSYTGKVNVIPSNSNEYTTALNKLKERYYLSDIEFIKIFTTPNPTIYKIII